MGGPTSKKQKVVVTPDKMKTRETRSKIATNTGGKKTEEIKEKGKTSAKEKGIINEPRLIDTEPTKQEKETQDKIKDEEVSEDEAIENAIMKSIEEQHKKNNIDGQPYHTRVQFQGICLNYEC